MSSPSSRGDKRIWWKDGVVYQIYPASFKDSNKDGMGDLPGIISKLDYIASIGVDIVWISPMYDSPQADLGYDISDYESVYPPYGTVKDMDDLIQGIHARGMRVILDLVVNHTSDQHAWFKESRSSKTNPKRDWYIWRPARYDEAGNRLPPNNWLSNFHHQAWTWDEKTEEYYLNLFLPEQADLNWENPETRAAIRDSAMHFWLKKGIDGFRVDTVNMYSKGDLRDAPITNEKIFHQLAGDVFCNGPRIHEFLREMHKEALSKYNDGITMTVGELPCTPDPQHVLKYISADDPQLSMVFQFDIVDLGTGLYSGKPKFEYTPFPLSEYKRLWTQMQTFTAGTTGWPTTFLENHDQGRSVSRYADDSPRYRDLSAKMLAMMLTTMTGTLFLYQGQEIGVINAPKDWPLDEYIDCDSNGYLRAVREREPDDPAAIERVRKSLQILGREHARLPMQWDASNQYAGFTAADGKKPWMRVHDAYKDINVEKQEGDKSSVLNFWRHLLALRKKNVDLFAHGTFECLDPKGEQTFCFVKSFADQTAVVDLNYTGEEVSATDAKRIESLHCILSNYGDEPNASQKLRPWEGRIYM